MNDQALYVIVEQVVNWALGVSEIEGFGRHCGYWEARLGVERADDTPAHYIFEKAARMHF